MDPEAFLGNVTHWAREKDDIRVVLLLGSRARRDRPADEFSDIDLTITVDDPIIYLDESWWLERFGPFVYSFVQPATPGPHSERRVFFADGQLVDFAFRSTADTEADIRDGLPPARAAVVARGYRILLDKLGVAPTIEAAIKANKASRGPSQAEFEKTVNRFWLLTMVANAKLNRGEFWTAAGYVNGSMASALEDMLRWQAQIVQPEIETWHNGRFLEDWVAPSSRDALADALTRPEGEAIARSLKVVADVFLKASSDVANGHGFRFPVVDAEPALQRIRALKAVSDIWKPTKP
jgi:aminoglycoside 6-adenylyltransferase